jgi:hypothetical protein
MVESPWLTVAVCAQVALIFIAFLSFLLNPKAGRKDFFVLGLILFITASSEAVVVIGFLVFTTNMNLIYNLSFLIILPLFLLFYKSRINSKQIGRILNSVISVFLVCGLINFFFVQGPTDTNSYTSSFGNISMIVVSVTYFYFLIKELPTETITKLPMFWINTAVLIYYSGVFFLYLTVDYLVTVLNDDMINSWTLHNFLGTIYYLMLAFALWLNRSNHLRSLPSRVNTIP